MSLRFSEELYPTITLRIEGVVVSNLVPETGYIYWMILLIFVALSVL